MSIYFLTPILCAIAYSILAVIVLRGKRTKVRFIFVIYLFISLLFAISTIAAIHNFFSNYLFVLCAFIPIFGILAVISYYHFICVFTNRGNLTVVKSCYGLVLFIVIPMAILGYYPQSAELVNGGLSIDHGPILYLFGAIGILLAILSVHTLVQKFRSSKDPVERNKVLYLLIGIGTFMVFSIRETFPPLPIIPLNQVGHFFNALIIAYAIMRYQLFDIRMVIRKGLVYTGITAIIAAVFLGILFILHETLRDRPLILEIMSVIALASLLSLSFNFLRRVMEKTINKVFYGKNYDYREMVINFTQRMSNVLDLNQLAEAMLKPISKALTTNQVSLLLPDNENFNSRFSIRFIEDEAITPLKLRGESPIIDWFRGEKKPLSKDIINSKPIFKALWESDTEALTDAELLFPLISNDKLVSILALSKRHNGGLYNNDDIDLITTLTSEAAVVIENAELYARAKEKVNTDDLTGLFNHRYFHERTDEEITRSARFGEVFSLLNIDLDFFKTYNDVHGHLYGDYILQEVSKLIKQSIRNIDMAFRYGGDEFSVILPQTSIDGACRVAKRIRKALDSGIDDNSRLLTCSIGIACWPTDGVMREELIQKADAALYYAKQKGRNRTYLSSEIPISDVLNGSFSTDNKGAILNTIYALAATVDAKDHYTYGHSKKVCRYATDIAEALGLPEERVSAIHTAALLHDIGKIGVSDQILKKTGPLDDEEWEPIHAHPTMGVSILKHVENLRDCLAAVQYHHEHYDGSGYPSGLKGSNIPFDARILAVADSFDAMTSSRPYRDKMTLEDALDEIIRCSGTQFDPEIVKVFVKLISPSIPVKRIALK